MVGQFCLARRLLDQLEMDESLILNLDLEKTKTFLLD